MSYILDALRRADAERDRGNVPGIHAQPTFGTASPARAQQAAPPWAWLAAGALAVVLIGGIAWFLAKPDDNRASMPVAVAPVTAPVPAPAPLAAPALAPPAAVATAPITPAPTFSVPRPAVVAPRPDAALAIHKAKPTAPVLANSSAPAETKPAAAAEKIYTLNDLPDDIRRQLPNLTVGGSMYSSQPADRILILNGQVVHEGDRVGTDLVLQQIRLKGALLNFRGYRYTISF